MRTPCCEKMGLKKGPWTPEEDLILTSYIQAYGHDNWRALPKEAGLLRCGKSCRLRWTNYLRPDIKRGNFTKEDEETIIKLHQVLGNRWSAIAARLPGRTDNEIKNLWHTRLKKRLSQKIVVSSVTAPADFVKFYAHLNSQTSDYTMISSRNLSENVANSVPSVLTTWQNVKNESSKDRAGEAIDGKILSRTNYMTRTFEGGIDQRHHILSPTEPLADHRARRSYLNESNDMKFWYNLFVRAGEAQKS